MTSPSRAGWGTEIKRSVEEARALAMTLVVQARASAAAAAALRDDAVELRVRARAIRSRLTGRPALPSHRVVSFSLKGVIEHRSVHAEWRDGRLVADPLLLERAQLLVGLGDKFESPNAGPFTASLTGLPVVGLLTLMRACDRVFEIDVAAPSGRPGPSRAERA